MATPTTRHRSDPELWPSAAHASALLLSIETIARLRGHIAPTLGASRSRSSTHPARVVIPDTRGRARLITRAVCFAGREPGDRG